MKEIREVNINSLRWERTGRLESRLLAASDQIVATLDWANELGLLATGESAQGQWTFKRVGSLRPRITIRRAGSRSDLAAATITWLGGFVIDFPSANGASLSFRLKRTGLLKQKWILTDAKGHRVLALTPDTGRRKQGSAVQIEKTEKTSPEKLSLLAILAWYLLLLTSRYNDDRMTGALVAIMGAST